MEVLEVIAKSNHRPKRSFYVAFGHDEEVRAVYWCLGLTDTG